MLSSMCSSDRGAQQPGAVVRVGQQQTERKGVEKLLQIGVVQRRTAGRKRRRRAPARTARAGRPARPRNTSSSHSGPMMQAHAERCCRQRHLRLPYRPPCRRGRAAGQSADRRRLIIALPMSEPIHMKRDSRSPPTGSYAPRAAQLPAERHGRHALAPYAERRSGSETA